LYLTPTEAVMTFQSAKEKEPVGARFNAPAPPQGNAPAPPQRHAPIIRLRRGALKRAPNDLICGGSGNDKLYGENGYDRLDGGSGRDYCDGGSPILGDAGKRCEKTHRIP